MWSSALASSIHILGVAVALGGLYMRGVYFRALRDTHRLADPADSASPGPASKAAFNGISIADSFWGVAAILLIGSWMWRIFGGLEMGLEFYTFNGFFWLKMGLLGGAMVLELWPMVTLVRWRIADARDQAFDPSPLVWFIRINNAQLVVLLGIITAAPAMSRALWLLS